MDYLEPKMDILQVKYDVITLSGYDDDNDGSSPSLDYGDWFPRQQ